MNTEKQIDPVVSLFHMVYDWGRYNIVVDHTAPVYQEQIKLVKKHLDDLENMEMVNQMAKDKGIPNLAPFTCVVCGSQFYDTYKHTQFEVGGVSTTAQHKLHNDYFRAVRDNNYEKPCFCGGTVTIKGSGGDSYEASCNDCQYIFDED